MSVVLASSVDLDDDTYTRFGTSFRDALADFARRVALADVRYVVAISRKAPRVLNYFAGHPDFATPPVERCISERALPFLPASELQGQRVLLIDDTLIWGSTFSAVAHSLDKAGAALQELVLAKSLDSASEMFDRVDAPLSLNRKEMHEFIDLEIQSFGTLGIPYDLDHPILNVTLASSEDAPLAETFRSQFPTAVETTRRWQSAHDIRVFTVRAPSYIQAEHSQSERQYGPAKVRFFIDERARTVRAVPIYCLAISEDDVANPDLFASSGALTKAWRLMQEATAGNALGGNHAVRGLVYGAHYLASLELGGRFLSATSAVVKTPTADEQDCRFIFGPELAGSVAEAVEAVFAEYESDDHGNEVVVAHLANYTAWAQNKIDASAELAALASTTQGSEFLTDMSAYVDTAARYDTAAILSSIFEAQRRVYDRRTRERDNLGEDRLATGIPFAVIPNLVALSGIELDPNAFDFWCDAAVDGGTIVPKYAPSLSEPRVWIRSVRFGERDDERVRYWVHRTLTAMVNDNISRDDTRPESIGWFVAEKAFALMLSTMGSRLGNSLDADLRLGYDQYGARAIYANPDEGTFLLDWAVDSCILESERHQQQRAAGGGRPAVRGTVVRPSPGFFDFHPDSEQAGAEGVEARKSMPVEEQYPESAVAPDITIGSEHIGRLVVALDHHFTAEERTKHLLVLTTCATEDRFLAALTRELKLWNNGAAKRQANASRIANRFFRLARILESGQAADVQADVLKAVDELDAALKESATILAETRAKWEAFQGRQATIDALDAMFAPRGSENGLQTTWGIVRKQVDLSDQALQSDERHLRFASYVAERATSIARTVLSANGWVADTRKGPAKKPLARLVAEYNENIDVSTTARLSGFKPEHLPDNLFDGDSASQCRAAAAVFAAARDTVVSTLADWSHPRPPNRLNVFELDMALVMWDVTGSSATQELAGGQAAVDAANQRIGAFLRKLNVDTFQPNQDDGNVALVPTVEDALELFGQLAETFNSHGESIKASIETTVDSEKLSRNAHTGQFAGRVYQKAARAMTFFKDALSQIDPANPKALTYSDPDTSGAIPLEAPRGSYVVISAHALSVLDHVEVKGVPAWLEPLGVAHNFVPRATSVLPTELHAFAWKQPGQF